MIYIRHYLAKIFFIITWIPWYLMFKTFVHYKIVYEDRSVRNLKGSILIIANHSSRIDPFLISLPFPIFSRILPIHFAVWPKLLSIPGINIFIWILGGFGVYKNIGLEQALEKPIEFLDKGWAIGVFPQGSRRKLFGRPKKGRRGVGYIALKKDPFIIPIFIKGAEGLSVPVFFSRRKHITIYIGKEFHLPRNMKEQGNASETAEFLMQKLYLLQNVTIQT